MPPGGARGRCGPRAEPKPGTDAPADRRGDDDEARRHGQHAAQDHDRDGPEARGRDRDGDAAHDRRPGVGPFVGGWRSARR